jgi:hypothetical protein
VVHTRVMAKEQEPKEQKAKEPKAPKEQKSKEPKEVKAKEKKSKEPEDKPEPKKDEKGLLETAAEAIGSTIGAIAVKTGIVHPEPRVSQKIPKLVKKNKSRLPRKEKKRARKAKGR